MLIIMNTLIIMIMKSIKYLFSLLISLFVINSGLLAQQIPYQTFAKDGFKVKCDCKLYVNSLHIQMSKQQGINNIVNSFVCAENENNPDIVVIFNITISDVSELYKNLPSSYALAEKSYFEQYASNLRSYGATSLSNTTFQGLSALEYTYDQMGVQTKAIIFVKDKKSYMLQVATRRNLTTKYNALKSSFAFL